VASKDLTRRECGPAILGRGALRDGLVRAADLARRSVTESDHALSSAARDSPNRTVPPGPAPDGGRSVRDVGKSFVAGLVGVLAQRRCWGSRPSSRSASTLDHLARRLRRRGGGRVQRAHAPPRRRAGPVRAGTAPALGALWQLPPRSAVRQL